VRQDAAVNSFSPAQVETVSGRVDAHALALVGLSHAIAADPELAYEEHRAAARCADLLAEHGFAVERGAYGQPTAFAARLGSTGPHVVVCAEYDALPGVGHACGHNVIAASAVGAGLALAPLVEEAGLRLTVLGTPAEEAGGGKVDLILAGAFEGVDAALMVHPTPYDDHAPRALAIEEWRVVHRGRASHASSAPELGLNALDGVVQGYTALAMLRQHLRPLQQVHGVIVDGGQAANVVPERAEASYFLRAVDADDLEDLRNRARACLEGAALATGTTVEIEREGHVYEPIDAHPGLAELFSAACAAIGRPSTPDPAGEPVSGSTDFGNVSQLVPGLHADLAVHTWPVVNHQHEFAAACVGEAGDRTMLDGAKALALTALAVAADPAVLGRGHPAPGR
jgi:amidohydrolase